jgi:hypothetical protein
MKYLIISASSFTEKEWKNPRTIDKYWFGDSPENCAAHGDILPDTQAARTELETLSQLYSEMEAAKDRLMQFRFEMLNKKKRGELA